MAETYYIDGYNVLHKDSALSTLAGQNLEAARDALVEAVSRWCAIHGYRACVFFDGQGRAAERIPGGPGQPHIEVVFTASHLSADALIERGVYTAEDRQAVVVVSGDRSIRDLCLGMGALSMTPEHFLSMLHAARPGAYQLRPSAGRGTRLGAMEDLVDEAARHQLDALRERLRDKQSPKRPDQS